MEMDEEEGDVEEEEEEEGGHAVDGSGSGGTRTRQRLRSLCLAGCDALTWRGLVDVAQAHGRSLRVLSLHGLGHGLDDGALEALLEQPQPGHRGFSAGATGTGRPKRGRWANLRSLNLSLSAISDDGVRRLEGALCSTAGASCETPSPRKLSATQAAESRLKHLNLRCCPLLSQERLASLRYGCCDEIVWGKERAAAPSGGDGVATVPSGFSGWTPQLLRDRFKQAPIGGGLESLAKWRG